MGYAAETEVPVEKSKAEIERLVTRYGAERFMVGIDQRRAVMAFQVRGKMVQFFLPLPDRSEKRFWFTPNHVIPRIEEITRDGKMPGLLMLGDSQ